MEMVLDTSNITLDPQEYIINEVMVEYSKYMIVPFKNDVIHVFTLIFQEEFIGNSFRHHQHHHETTGVHPQ